MFVCNVTAVAHDGKGDVVLRGARYSPDAWAALQLGLQQVMRGLAAMERNDDGPGVAVSLTATVACLFHGSGQPEMMRQARADREEDERLGSTADTMHTLAKHDQVVSVDPKDYGPGGLYEPQR